MKLLSRAPKPRSVPPSKDELLLKTEMARVEKARVQRKINTLEKELGEVRAQAIENDELVVKAAMLSIKLSETRGELSEIYEKQREITAWNYFIEHGAWYGKANKRKYGKPGDRMYDSYGYGI